ncbi:MAG: hypothetical protein RSE36_08565, partial [Oscillospiraceae bacterium]
MNDDYQNYDERLVDLDERQEDFENENSLRPQTLDEYVGQQQIKENLSIYMQAAKLRNEPLDHLLLYGP